MEIIHLPDFMTLGQFLKYEGIIDTGGHAKYFLADYEVLLNGEREHRRGKKLNHLDVVTIEDVGTYQIQYEQDT